MQQCGVEIIEAYSRTDYDAGGSTEEDKSEDCGARRCCNDALRGHAHFLSEIRVRIARCL